MVHRASSSACELGQGAVPQPGQQRLMLAASAWMALYSPAWPLVTRRQFTSQVRVVRCPSRDRPLLGIKAVQQPGPQGRAGRVDPLHGPQPVGHHRHRLPGGVLAGQAGQQRFCQRELVAGGQRGRGGAYGGWFSSPRSGYAAW